MYPPLDLYDHMVDRFPGSVYIHWFILSLSIIVRSSHIRMGVTSFTVKTNIWQSYVTGEYARNHKLPVGRCCDILGLYISLIYVQGSLFIADTPLPHSLPRSFSSQLVQRLQSGFRSPIASTLDWWSQLGCCWH